MQYALKDFISKCFIKNRYLNLVALVVIIAFILILALVVIIAFIVIVALVVIIALIVIGLGLPVSKLCFIAKILEKLVLSQVSSYLNSHNVYNTCQSAYRPGHSTEAALLKVVNDLSTLQKHGIHATLLIVLRAYHVQLPVLFTTIIDIQHL